jgi:hypothetical protein
MSKEQILPAKTDQGESAAPGKISYLKGEVGDVLYRLLRKTRKVTSEEYIDDYKKTITNNVYDSTKYFRGIDAARHMLEDGSILKFADGDVREVFGLVTKNPDSHFSRGVVEASIRWFGDLMPVAQREVAAFMQNPACRSSVSYAVGVNMIANMPSVTSRLASIKLVFAGEFAQVWDPPL